MWSYYIIFLFQQISQCAVDYVVEGAANLIQQSVPEYESKVLHVVYPYPSIGEQVKDKFVYVPILNIRNVTKDWAFVDQGKCCIPYT